MRKSTKLKIFRRKKRSVILSVLKRHSLRQHTVVNCARIVKESSGEQYDTLCIINNGINVNGKQFTK